MFDIGWQEIFVLAVLAIIVIGPKDLPRAMKTVTQWIRKARTMAREFQSGIDDVVREVELEDLKAEANKAANFDIAGDIKDSLDPDGDLAEQMDMSEVEKGMDEAVRDYGSTEPKAVDAAETPKYDTEAPAPDVEPAIQTETAADSGMDAPSEPAADVPAGSETKG